MSKRLRYIFIISLFILIQTISKPAFACVKGLSWGMELSKVESHLGTTLKPIENQKNNDLFEIKEYRMSKLPVNSLKLRITEEQGLKQLVYEISYDNMIEVLAGLRNRYGSPVGTTADIEEDNPHQQWIWHTGEDIITAVKSQDKPFILFYRPSLLDPTFL